MKRRKRKLYDSGEKMGGKKVTMFLVAIDVQKSPHFYVGQLRITINVYIHQSNHQKTQTIGVKIYKKHKN